MRPQIKSYFDNVGDLARWNLIRIAGEVKDRDSFHNYSDKEVGGTVGKIVYDSDRQYWLLKKSGRTQTDSKALAKDEDPEREKSRFVTHEQLQEGIAESFNEKCAAELFSRIKNVEGYLPSFVLVSSEFTVSESKRYNR